MIHQIQYGVEVRRWAKAAQGLDSLICGLLEDEAFENINGYAI